MRIGSLVFCTLLLAMVLALAGAPDLRVVRSNNTSELSVDVESIKTIEGSHTEVRVLEIYRNQKLEGLFTATASLRFVPTVQASLSNLVFMSSKR
jgi:hypothetical protein